jgi:hypothetical protein
MSLVAQERSALTNNARGAAAPRALHTGDAIARLRGNTCAANIIDPPV